MVKINNMLKSAVADTGEVDMVKDTGEKKKDAGGWTSLVVQRLSICLPMQEIWAQSLVWGDSTCCRATEPKSHNC